MSPRRACSCLPAPEQPPSWPPIRLPRRNPRKQISSRTPCFTSATQHIHWRMLRILDVTAMLLEIVRHSYRENSASNAPYTSQQTDTTTLKTALTDFSCQGRGPTTTRAFADRQRFVMGNRCPCFPGRLWQSRHGAIPSHATGAKYKQAKRD